MPFLQVVGLAWKDDRSAPVRTTDIDYIYLDTKLAIKRVQKSCDKQLHTCPTIRRKKKHCAYKDVGIKFIFPYYFAKYPLFQKFFKIKVVKHPISYQKVSGCIRLSPPGGELQVSKDRHFRNITMYKNGKVNSL